MKILPFLKYNFMQHHKYKRFSQHSGNYPTNSIKSLIPQAKYIIVYYRRTYPMYGYYYTCAMFAECEL